MKRQIVLTAGILTAALAITTTTLAGKGTIDAASMKVTIYRFAVSTSADCSKPVVVFSNTSGLENDLLANPTYGSGPVDPGTYNCVMIEMSKGIKTSAASTSGSCTAGTEFSDIVCGDGQPSQLIDGTSVACSGGSANPQHVTLYITTASAGQSGDRSLLPPLSAADTTSGLKLTAPLVVSADAPVTLTVDPKDFLDGTQPQCGTSAPDFGVR